jgi:hypothetical protein
VAGPSKPSKDKKETNRCSYKQGKGMKRQMEKEEKVLKKKNVTQEDMNYLAESLKIIARIQCTPTISLIS